MSKISYTIILVGCAIFLMGCTTNKQENVQNRVTWQEIAKAVTSGKSVKCDLTGTQTSNVGLYYVKGEKLKFDLEHLTNSDNSISFIIDEKFIYTWNDAKKEGSRFANADLNTDNKQLAATISQIPDFSTQEDWNDYENMGYIINCVIGDVDNNVFIPAADIKFTDLTQTNQL